MTMHCAGRIFSPLPALSCRRYINSTKQVVASMRITHTSFVLCFYEVPRTIGVLQRSLLSLLPCKMWPLHKTFQKPPVPSSCHRSLLPHDRCSMISTLLHGHSQRVSSTIPHRSDSSFGAQRIADAPYGLCHLPRRSRILASSLVLMAILLRTKNHVRLDLPRVVDHI
jgi:hypothetical protein